MLENVKICWRDKVTACKKPSLLELPKSTIPTTVVQCTLQRRPLREIIHQSGLHLLPFVLIFCQALSLQKKILFASPFLFWIFASLDIYRQQQLFYFCSSISEQKNLFFFNSTYRVKSRRLETRSAAEMGMSRRRSTSDKGRFGNNCLIVLLC